MSKRKSFWQKIREKLEDFTLDVLDKLLGWIKSLLDWIGELIAEIAEELRIHIGLLIFLLFGVATYLTQEIMPMTEEKRSYFSFVGGGVSIGSIALILIQVIKTLLKKLGLLDPLIRLRDKILEKFNLSDSTTQNTENAEAKKELSKVVNDEVNGREGIASNQTKTTSEHISA